MSRRGRHIRGRKHSRRNKERQREKHSSGKKMPGMKIANRNTEHSSVYWSRVTMHACMNSEDLLVNVVRLKA